MSAKKAVLAACLVAAAALPAAAQWKTEIASLVAEGRDLRAASDILRRRFATLEEADKADAAALLAFCADRIGDREEAGRWMGDFFELYGAKDSGFAFLSLVSQAEVVGYVESWKRRYPWITEIALIKGAGGAVIVPQGILPLAVQIANRALFKFAEGTEVLEAGEFQPGFNILGLDANALIASGSRTRIYSLEVKTGDIVVRKEITLDVAVEGWRPAAPLSRPASPAQPGSTRPVEYRLSLYVGDKLVMSSRKTERPLPLAAGLKPTQNPVFLKPDYYTKKGDPWASPSFNQFSIIDAIGLVYNVLKDLLSKKNKPGEAPKLETVRDLSLSIPVKDQDGADRTIRVSLRLNVRAVRLAG